MSESRRTKPLRPTSAELQAALLEPKAHKRSRVFREYSLHRPDPADLPLLRHALYDPEISVVNCAIISIGKLGRKATEVVDELFELARKPGPPEMGIPQHMNWALWALARIAPRDRRILDLAREALPISNYADFQAAVEALVALGTEEALQSLRQVDRYWGTTRKSKTEDELVNKAIDRWTGVKSEIEQAIEHRGAVFRRRADGTFRCGVYCPKCARPMTSIKGQGPYQCRHCNVRVDFTAQDLERVMAEIKSS